LRNALLIEDVPSKAGGGAAVRAARSAAQRAAKRRWGNRFSRKIGGTAGLAQPRRRPSHLALPRRAPTLSSPHGGAGHALSGQ